LDHPLVSILIPLYNHARYIEVCLDSIRNDPWPAKEVLIVDDGSTDESVQVAQDWYDRHPDSGLVRFELKSRPNKGLTPTINELTRMAAGDYLVLLASDDFLLPGGIGSRVEYLRSHPDKLAVFSDCLVVDDNGKVLHESGIRDLHGGRLHVLENPELMDLELIFNWCVPGPVFMAHRELYRQLGGYDENLVVEDWDMYLRICARGLLGFVPGPVAAYRYHGGNTICSGEKCIALDKCHIRSAWRQAWSFSGLRRYGLLYQHFRLRHKVATQERRKVAAYVAKNIAKMLRRVSIKPYRRLVEKLPPPPA
jgi:glycosyltransferase involved in cell wall biosynthesis